MYKQKEEGQDFIQLLDRKKTIAVPTDSIYFFLSHNLQSFTNQKNSSANYVKFISGTDRIYHENIFLPVSTRAWIDLLTPGPLIIEIDSDKNSFVQRYYYSGDRRLINIIQKSDQDFYGSPLIISRNLYCSDNTVAKEVFSDVQILESNPSATGFLPSVLRITDNDISLYESIGTHVPKNLRSLSNSEFQIPDKPIPVINQILGGQKHPNKVAVNFINDISEVNRAKAVILGSKEKIQLSYNLHLDFFKEITNGNHLLINIGSLTNIPNIIKNLFENIYKALRTGLPIFFLNQNWGSSHRIMQEILDTICQSEFKIPNSFVIA